MVGADAPELLITEKPLQALLEAMTELSTRIAPFLKAHDDSAALTEALGEGKQVEEILCMDAKAFQNAMEQVAKGWEKINRDNAGLHHAANTLAPLAETCRDLVKQVDQLYKLAARVVEVCEKELGAKKDDAWPTREINRTVKSLEVARQEAVAQLKQARYFFKQAKWLQERFPDAELRDVAGLVKLVNRTEIAANDWSLTPGRYVGVAPEEVDENFDFEEALRAIHMELLDLNLEASDLSDRIASNFEELGI